MAQDGLAETPISIDRKPAEVTQSLFDSIEVIRPAEKEVPTLEVQQEVPIQRATVIEPTLEQSRFTTEPRSQNSTCFNSYDAQECEAVNLTNEHRRRNGLPPLSIAQNCSNLAVSHAQDMAQNNFFSHDSPYNGSFAQRANQFQLRGGGENIAKGFNSAQRVIDGWIRSPGHNRNMLEPGFTKIGIARVGDTWVQCFTR